ncbi:YDG domain-containing protein, partial [Duganella phyllosphaerae]|uniref:YDG domain-containing protein n=1 Tax=Duganella phyllosphaerae TaxID=762836 RepID=UPI000A9BF857
GVAGSSYTVTAKGLTLTGVSAVDKIYDATTTAALNTASVGYSGLVSGDTVAAPAAVAAVLRPRMSVSTRL